MVLYIIAVFHYYEDDKAMFIFETLLATGGLLNLLLLKLFGNVKLAENFILVGMLLLVIAIFINGGYENTGIYWIYTFPLLSFFIKGNREGFVWNLGLIAVVCLLVYLDYRNVVPIAYSYVEIRQSLLAYVIVMILAYIFEDALLRSYNKVSKMAVTDQLTGLYNRHYIFRKLSEEVKRARRYRENLCVILIDIDNFKSINDRFGHDVGDAVLKKVAEILRCNVREIDTVGRLGGEEFIIICPRTNIVGGRILGEKIRAVVENLREGNIPRITVSVGVGAFSSFDTPHELIKKADVALYRAKKSGKNKVVVYEILNPFINNKKEPAAVGRH